VSALRRPVLLALIFILLMIFAYLGLRMMSPDHVTTPFASMIDERVKVNLISRFNESEKSTLLDEIKANDATDEIYTDSWADDLKKSHVLLILLSNWSDARSLPLSEIFEKYYDEVSQNPTDLVRVTYQISVNDRMPFMLVFYNLGSVPNSTISCLSKDIVNVITIGEQDHDVFLASCK
jgi:hypothetical protein